MIVSEARMAEKQLRRDAHRSTAELEAALRRYPTVQNQVAKPLVWTKTADDAILESVARFCKRTCGSGTVAQREPVMESRHSPARLVDSLPGLAGKSHQPWRLHHPTMRHAR